MELPTQSKECIDRRVAGEDYLLSREETDAWNENNWKEASAQEGGVDGGPSHSLPESGCEERWQNMQDQNTVKSAAKYFENGWFVLLCRHMMFIVGCDMIKSGERCACYDSVFSSY